MTNESIALKELFEQIGDDHILTSI
ncbi:MAG: hypothetical protein RLZ10_2351, partial [Bacteroidota bacterium]